MDLRVLLILMVYLRNIRLNIVSLLAVRMSLISHHKISGQLLRTYHPTDMLLYLMQMVSASTFFVRSTSYMKNCIKSNLPSLLFMFMFINYVLQGVSTLQGSYNHLSRCGKLITYGFHSNIPMGASFLSPMEWIRMIIKMTQVRDSGL